MLVLTSTKANILSIKPEYRDYIFYTDLRIDPLKFKIIHSIEFFHEKSDYHGLFHVYLLFGGGGTKYYIGSFFQKEEAECISFEGIQQLNTIDIGAYTESVVTVRIYHRDFLSKTVIVAGHEVTLGSPNNYISTLGDLDCSNPNATAVAVGEIEFKSGGDRFPYARLLEGSYIDFTNVANLFGTTNRWTHGFRYRTKHTNVKLFWFRDVDGKTIYIDIDQNGYILINNVGLDEPFRNDDDVWRMLFITPLDNILKAHVLHGEGVESSFPSINMDVTPADTLYSAIGAHLSGSHLQNVPYSRYLDMSGNDLGTFGYNTAAAAGTTEFTQNGRTGLRNELEHVFNLSNYNTENVFNGNKFSVAYWYNSDDLNFISADGNPIKISFCIRDNTAPEFDRFAVVHSWLGGLHTVKARLCSITDGSFVVGSGTDDDGSPDTEHVGWHHIAVVMGYNDEDEYEFKLYWDGVLRYDYHAALISRNDLNEYTLASTVATLSDTRVYIGGWGGTFRNFEAAISDFQIYDRVLSQKDVHDIYHSAAPVTGNRCDVAQIYSADETIFPVDRMKIYQGEDGYETGELENWNLRLKIEQV